MNDFTRLSDQFITQMHESIRKEVRADAVAGTRLIGLPARQRADRLFEEIQRRGLVCAPIEWPDDVASPSLDMQDEAPETIAGSLAAE